MDIVKHYIDSEGDEVWVLDGKYHRVDGPAIIMANGDQFWRYHGQFHREDGPAAIYNDGRVGWYLNSYIYSFDEYCNKLNLAPEQILELKIKYG